MMSLNSSAYWKEKYKQLLLKTRVHLIDPVLISCPHTETSKVNWECLTKPVVYSSPGFGDNTDDAFETSFFAPLSDASYGSPNLYSKYHYKDQLIKKVIPKASTQNKENNTNVDLVDKKSQLTFSEKKRISKNCNVAQSKTHNVRRKPVTPGINYTQLQSKMSARCSARVLRSPKALAQTWIRDPITSVHSKTHLALSPMVETLKTKKKNQPRPSNEPLKLNCGYDNTNYPTISKQCVQYNTSIYCENSPRLELNRPSTSMPILVCALHYLINNADLVNDDSLKNNGKSELKLDAICGLNFSSQEMDLLVVEYLLFRLRNIINLQTSIPIDIQKIVKRSEPLSSASTSTYDDVEFLH